MLDLEKLRSELVAAWPPIISRDDIAHYTGGMYSSKTMQTYDSKGCGVKDPVRSAGRKVGYQKDELINWFLSRLEAANAKNEH